MVVVDFPTRHNTPQTWRDGPGTRRIKVAASGLYPLQNVGSSFGSLSKWARIATSLSFPRTASHDCTSCACEIRATSVSVSDTRTIHRFIRLRYHNTVGAVYDPEEGVSAAVKEWSNFSEAQSPPCLKARRGLHLHVPTVIKSGFAGYIETCGHDRSHRECQNAK